MVPHKVGKPAHTLVLHSRDEETREKDRDFSMNKQFLLVYTLHERQTNK